MLAMVAVGGALGAVLRFALARAADRPLLPWGTLAANLVASAVLGMLAAGAPPSPEWQLLVMVGVLGSLSTVSSLAGQVIGLWHRPAGHWLALRYLLLSLCLGIAAAAAGYQLGAGLWP